MAGTLLRDIVMWKMGQQERDLHNQYLKDQIDLMKQQTKLEEKKVQAEERRVAMFMHALSKNTMGDVGNLMTGGIPGLLKGQLEESGGPAAVAQGLGPAAGGAISPQAQNVGGGQQPAGGGITDDILAALRTVESGSPQGNYQAAGGQNEIGAYQYLPSTWQARSQSAGMPKGVSLVPYPEVQDAVARQDVDTQVRAGKSPEEIARYWNSGSTTGTPVPGYLDKFKAALGRGGGTGPTMAGRPVAMGDQQRPMQLGDDRSPMGRAAFKYFTGLDPGEEKVSVHKVGNDLAVFNGRGDMTKIIQGPDEYDKLEIERANGSKEVKYVVRPRGGWGAFTGLVVGGGGKSASDQSLPADIPPMGGGEYGGGMRPGPSGSEGIQVAPPKPAPVADAGKIQLAQSGLDALEEVNGLVYNPDGSVNTANLFNARTGMPFTAGGGLASSAFRAADAIVRAATGAGMGPTEQANYQMAYVPRFGDTQETIATKMKALEGFLNGYLEKMDPSGTLRARVGPPAKHGEVRKTIPKNASDYMKKFGAQ